MIPTFLKSMMNDSHARADDFERMHEGFRQRVGGVREARGMGATPEQYVDVALGGNAGAFFDALRELGIANLGEHLLEMTGAVYDVVTEADEGTTPREVLEAGGAHAAQRSLGDYLSQHTSDWTGHLVDRYAEHQGRELANWEERSVAGAVFASVEVVKLGAKVVVGEVSAAEALVEAIDVGIGVAVDVAEYALEVALDGAGPELMKQAVATLVSAIPVVGPPLSLAVRASAEPIARLAYDGVKQVARTIISKGREVLKKQVKAGLMALLS